MIDKRDTLAPSESIQAVKLALDILELLANAEHPLGITEISDLLDVGKSRVFRHLRMFCASGYALQNPETEKYEAGSTLYAIGHSLSMTNGLIKAVRPAMRSLTEQLGLTTTLTRVEADKIVVIDVCASANSIAIVLPVGFRMDTHATAHGKVALAFGPALLRDATFGKPLRAVTSETTTDQQALERELLVVRRQGWAISRDESVMGMTALAAPIFSKNAIWVGTLGLLGSSQVIKKSPSREQLEALLAVTRAASQRLGYSPVE